MPRDYYEILGLGKDASEDEIKRSYRKLALKYHPDRNPEDHDAEEKFREAAEAYEVLRDADKRARYDRFGHAGVGNGSSQFHSNEDIFSAFSDIFGDIFGFSTGARGPRPQAGADLRYNLDLSFREAARGVEKEIVIHKHVPCPECEGTGAKPGTSPETCAQCGGQGQVHASQGFFRIATTCPICRGTGTVVKEHCPKCKGRTVIQEAKELNVRIPGGVDHGARLRLRGEGEPGVHGGPPGDLYVVLRVDDDKTFDRQGQDLIYRLELSMVDAALGKKVEVPTLDEPEELAIPKGTQSGEVFQLKDKGLPYIASQGTGDLLVEVTVKTPTRLTSRQEELLKEFRELDEEKLTSKAKNLWDKAKKAMGG